MPANANTQLTLWEDGRTPDGATRRVGVLQSSAAQAATKLGVLELSAEADQYAAAAYAPRTRKARQHDWSAFDEWCRARNLTALPASTDTLRCYLAYLAKLGRKASTIRRARVSIGLMHEHVGAPRPDRNALIREVERGIGRLHGTREEGAAPLLEHHIATIVRHLGDSPRDVRDRAIILLGFAGAFRAGELCGLRIEHLAFTSAGLRVLVARSKEDQLGRGTYTDIPLGTTPATCPVEALRAWLAHVARPTGPLFRIINGSQIEHAAISERAVSRAVQRAASRAEIPGEYSAHSLRKGLCTSAHANGATRREIQVHARMLTERTLERYLFTERVPGRRNVAAGLL